VPDLVEGVRGILTASASDVEKRLEQISRRQDELADQLLLGDSSEIESTRAHQRDHPFAFAGMTDLENLLRLLSTERRQTAALLLAHVAPDVASAVLSRLPEQEVPEILTRIARLERVAPAVLAEVGNQCRRQLEAMGEWEPTGGGGVDAVAELLTLLPRSMEGRVVQTLAMRDTDLSQQIKKRMFLFEDIVELEPQAVALVLRRADPKDLALALKTVESEVRDRILAEAPDREATEAAMAEMGRRRLAEIDAAQSRIVALIRSMEEDGEIAIALPPGTVD
jgi:flagellar motor switch protein FliG